MADEIKKLRHDGKVAVLVSPGFGAGWFSWNKEIPACLFDPDIIAAIVDGKRDEATRIAYAKWPGGSWGGIDGLEVQWLREGTRFIIDEYDGSEQIKTVDDLTMIA
jgi:hypothetical protein